MTSLELKYLQFRYITTSNNDFTKFVDDVVLLADKDEEPLSSTFIRKGDHEDRSPYIFANFPNDGKLFTIFLSRNRS